MAVRLATEKERMEEYEFMERVERIAIDTVYAVKGRQKTLCANVDFYSGFVYDLIGIPREIYTLFLPWRGSWAGALTETRSSTSKDEESFVHYRCVTDERGMSPSRNASIRSNWVRNIHSINIYMKGIFIFWRTVSKRSKPWRLGRAPQRAWRFRLYLFWMIRA